MTDQSGGAGSVQPHQRVEAVLENHHHVDAAQQLAQHDAFVDALPRPSGLRGSGTSSQFLKAARWSSPQNLERR